jgi:hypothetical protein
MSRVVNRPVYEWIFAEALLSGKIPSFSVPFDLPARSVTFYV